MAGKEVRCLRMEEKHSRKTFAIKRTGKIFLLAVLILGLQAVMKSCGAVVPEGIENQGTLGEAMLRSLADGGQKALYDQFMPGMSFLMDGGYRRDWLLRNEIGCLVPLYGFLTGQMETGEEERAEDFRTILLAEAEEGSYEVIPESEPETEDVRLSQEGREDSKPVQDRPGETGDSLSDLLRAENEAALQEQTQVQQSSPFVPHVQQTQMDLASLENYETLIKQFYTVDANTIAGSDQLDIHKFLGEDLTVSKEDEGPQILIYHTHSQEGFLDSVPGDASTTIMGVGEWLTMILTEQYGYQVLHHLGQYDIESRNDSYSAALTDLETILREYPSIQVVIDLHRDAMPENVHLAMDLDGRPTARFMFFNGLSRTKKTGNIAYLYNENLDGNLAFSFQMQKTAMEYYPGLTRKIYLKGYRYNMHLRPRSLLIELGAQNNTVEEAMNACEPLAHILDLVLSGQG